MMILRNRQMQRKIIVALFAVIYIFGCMVSPFAELLPIQKVYAAESVTILTVTGSVVNVRTGPGTEYSKLTTVTAGSAFVVQSSAEDTEGTLWYEVTISNQSGYIISKYCTVETQTVQSATSAEASSAISGQGNVLTVTGSAVNVRSGAGVAFGRVAIARKGDRFELLGSTTDSSGIVWYQIDVNGVTGYISSEFGSVSTTETTVNASASYLTVTGSVVNLRSGPGTSYLRVAALRKGDSYTILGSTRDSVGVLWYRISVNGVSGYIISTYVSVTAPPAASTSTTTTTVVPTTTTTTSPGTGSSVRKVTSGTVSLSSGTLNVRSGAGTGYGVVGTLSNGAVVIILGTSGDWYKIEYNCSSGYGYVKSSYIKNVKTETKLVTLAFGTDYYYVNVGSSVTVSASASGYAVSYSSSNTTAAPVNASTGVVSGKVAGMYTITATSGDLTATTQVVVLKAPYSGIQHMTISPEGTEFIAQWEGGGFYDSTLDIVTFTPYKDEAGYWTVGYGHAKTTTESKGWSYERAVAEFNIDIKSMIGADHVMTDVKPYLTQEEAYLLLNADLNDGVYVKAVSNWAVRNGVKLNQAQFDALVSFCFNMGPAYWTSDTYLFYLKSAIICQRSGDDADDAQVVEGFTRYIKAGGANLKGLWWRRRNEAEMFNEGDYEIDRENKFTLPNIVWG